MARIGTLLLVVILAVVCKVGNATINSLVLPVPQPVPFPVGGQPPPIIAQAIDDEPVGFGGDILMGLIPLLFLAAFLPGLFRRQTGQTMIVMLPTTTTITTPTTTTATTVTTTTATG